MAPTMAIDKIIPRALNDAQISLATHKKCAKMLASARHDDPETFLPVFCNAILPVLLEYKVRATRDGETGVAHTHAWLRSRVEGRAMRGLCGRAWGELARLARRLRVLTARNACASSFARAHSEIYAPSVWYDSSSHFARGARKAWRRTRMNSTKRFLVFC